eukprot:757736-Hanusia_phi.AAC.4
MPTEGGDVFAGDSIPDSNRLEQTDLDRPVFASTVDQSRSPPAHTSHTARCLSAYTHHQHADLLVCPVKTSVTALVTASQILSDASFNLRSTPRVGGGQVSPSTLEAVTSLRLTPSFDRWIGSQAKFVIHFVCPCRVSSAAAGSVAWHAFKGLPAGCPLAGSHNLASLSMLPDAASFPSGEYAQHLHARSGVVPPQATVAHKTQLAWPFKVVIGVSVLMSHTRKVASPDPVMSRLQSGENATQRIA